MRERDDAPCTTAASNPCCAPNLMRSAPHITLAHHTFCAVCRRSACCSAAAAPTHAITMCLTMSGSLSTAATATARAATAATAVRAHACSGVSLRFLAFLKECMCAFCADRRRGWLQLRSHCAISGLARAHLTIVHMIPAAARGRHEQGEHLLRLHV